MLSCCCCVRAPIAKEIEELLRVLTTFDALDVRLGAPVHVQRGIVGGDE